MQSCTSCGRENPAGFLHCGYCGAPLAPPPSSRRRLATLVFCDLVGSTALAERVDPESLQELMRLYFAEMRSALERHGGRVEKFIGDAVVGVFGVPAAREDDAVRACRAALEMQARVVELNGELYRRFRAEIATRVGVNSGEVVGSQETFVTGDAVNVAARLEQAAGPGEVLIGETTYRLVRDAAQVEPRTPLEAKGKTDPLTAHRLVAVGQSRRGALAPMVGRGRELERLEQELDVALAGGSCRILTVAGDAGVGKSRLASELLARLDGRARVARGACLSYGEGITFWALAQIVRELAGIREEQTLEEARARLPERIAQVVGLAEGFATADQIAEAVASFLSAAAQAQPLVLLLDDLQWAEPTLLELLASLPRRVGSAPIVLICLARPELLETRPDWQVTVALEPLEAADIDALLESLDAPAAVRVQLAATAGGNPLYAEELVAWVREGGDLDALPTSLNALLGARLDRLESDERDALERGAIEGEVFHEAAIVALSEGPAAEAVPGELGSLARKDVIRLAAATLVAGDAAYRFKHILVREATYRATAKKLRSTLHQAFAEWLERVAGARVGEYHEILGYHFEQAYRYREELGAVDEGARTLASRAAHHLGAAGRRANDRADIRAAANLLRRAASLLPADSRSRLELLRHLAYAVDQTGRMLEARSIAQELYERATAIGDRVLAAHGRSYATPHPFFDREADRAAAKAAFEDVIATFAEAGDEAGLAAAKRRLGLVHRSQGRRGVSIQWLEQALRHADAADDASTRRAVVYSLANDVTGGPTPVPDAIARCEALLATCGDDRVLTAAVTRHLGALLAMAGRFDEFRSCEARSAPVLDEAAVESLSWGSLSAGAYGKMLAGDYEGAEQALRAKWRVYPVEVGKTQILAVGAAYGLTNLLCSLGRWDEAEECLAAVRHTGHPSPARILAEARLAAQRGRHDEGLALAEKLSRRNGQSDNLNALAGIRLGIAEVQRAAGLEEAAARSVRRAVMLFEQKGNVAGTQRLMISMAP